jgi:hypothetical protein
MEAAICCIYLFPWVQMETLLSAISPLTNVSSIQFIVKSWKLHSDTNYCNYYNIDNPREQN